MGEVLLDVQNLKVHFPVRKGLVFAKQVGAVKAVDGVTFSVETGTTFGLVGESGCGKTTISKVLLLLQPMTDGTVRFRGRELRDVKGEAEREYRRSVQAVFQDPYSSLSPRMKVGEIIAEPLIACKAMPKKERKERVAELLRIVGLRPDGGELYPHEFSGGQRQRIAVARALALNPTFMILDEPVSALDVSIRAQILNLLGDIQERFGLTYLIIAHDLAVVEHVSNVVGVMYLGKLAELATTEDLYSHPLHPYTRALLAAVPRIGVQGNRDWEVVHGEVPSPLNPPAGCRFHPRCPMMIEECAQEEPRAVDIGNGHWVACHRARG